MHRRKKNYVCFQVCHFFPARAESPLLTCFCAFFQTVTRVGGGIISYFINDSTVLFISRLFFIVLEIISDFYLAF